MCLSCCLLKLGNFAAPMFFLFLVITNIPKMKLLGYRIKSGECPMLGRLG